MSESRPQATSNRLTALLVVVVALLGTVGGYSLWQVLQARSQPVYQALLVLPEAREIPAFELVDAAGHPFGPARLEGKWSLLFFGFTHCPDICPGTLYDLSQASKAIHAALSDKADRLQVVLVSVDPERDTPARLAEYIAFFDPSFEAVTGPHERLEPLTRKLGIAYRIAPHERGAAQYDVDHSASILLMDPQGRLHGVFPAPHDVVALQSDLIQLLARE